MNDVRDAVRDSNQIQGPGVIMVEPKWTSALALILSGFAVGFSLAAWERQDQSDAKWAESKRELDAAWATRLTENSGKWAQSYKELEREKRLLEAKVDDMAFALKIAGIDPTPSHGGNSP